MQSVTQEQILAIIQADIDPHAGCDWLTAGATYQLDIEQDHVRLAMRINYPAQTALHEIADRLKQSIEALAGVTQATVTVDWQLTAQVAVSAGIQGAGRIIAVASGKGGVGKSTCAANLALALQQEGAKVGVLDADIYGPSLGCMLGLTGKRPQIKEQKYFVPIQVYGISVMSMAFLTTDKTPMVWRGPMASGALKQMLQQTIWPNLDYLIVDMPPGTGDIQLTLAQKAHIAGAVVVTTPQDLALLDARRAIEMFAKVRVPVLGVIENMSGHVCAQCGHQESVFGTGGGERLAGEYEVPLLGTLPLAMAIRQQTDAGQPTVVAQPDSVLAQRYRYCARSMAARLAVLQQTEETDSMSLSVSDD